MNIEKCSAGWMRWRLLTVVVLSVVMWPGGAFAWNSTGHRLSALVAYDRMDVAARTKVVEMLKHHPRFTEDFERRMPEAVRDGSTEVQDRWIFSQAAVWPDIARGLPGELKRRYHRPSWHYVNEPVYLSDEQRDELEDGHKVNLKIEWRPRMRHSKMNVMQALDRCRKMLKAGNQTRAEQAVLICWFLHAAGDLHQPLHSTALFTQYAYPDGDRGGNRIVLSNGKKLHSYWDGAQGSANNAVNLWERVQTWAADTALKEAADQAGEDVDFVTWRDESYEIAAEKVYVHEILVAVENYDYAMIDSHEDDPKLEPVVLPEDYREMARQVSAVRINESGARMAKLLEVWYGE
ncbi:S1/P1 nuclease [Poriferisphaera sp. WC338]|uniref:S1/P1 nuclease n=1 Tax=Poriferisphaera sp. WC338 TaxID=3425129 RepID=UPI003D812E51